MKLEDQLADAEALADLAVCLAMGAVQALKQSGIDARPFIAARLQSVEATLNGESLNERRLASFQKLSKMYLEG